MNQFSAHLDRGWELVQKGDTRGAETSARRALELDPNSPEAHNLLGYVAALDGESEDAIEHYRQAIALDETYLEAMLNAAEIYIHPLGEFDRAVEMCNQALEIAEVGEEIIDALLLKFDALLGKGEVEQAKQVVNKIPEGPYPSAHHTFLVGRAFYEVGQPDKAAVMIEEAATKDPYHGEAQYYLGLIRDEQGDIRGATQAFLRSRELDLHIGMPPWAPSQGQFWAMSQHVIESLNPVLRGYVADAEVYIGDVPGVEVIVDGVDPRALVLLDGPPPEFGVELPEELRCTRIFMYALNIARLSGSVDALEQEMLIALEREISAIFLEAEQNERPAKELN